MVAVNSGTSSKVELYLKTTSKQYVIFINTIVQNDIDKVNIGTKSTRPQPAIIINQ